MDAFRKKYQIYGFKKFTSFVCIELYSRIINRTLLNSYSQKKEDIFIDKLLGNKQKGFYVDVGAHDPYQFSNTYRFYKKGWRGINLEPDETGYKKFVELRKRDINLNIGVGNTNHALTFYKFCPSALSTFSEREAKTYIRKGFTLEKKVEVKVEKLSSIFRKYLPVKTIDFMSIDTEGFETEVLDSNNWSIFKPRIICIESVTYGGKRKDDGYHKFLISVGYNKIYDNKLNSIYLLQQ